MRTMQLLAFFVICYREAAAQRLNEQDQLGQLTILAIDSFGSPIPTARSSIQELSNGKLLRTFDEGLEPSPLHYGVYRITVSNSGFESASKTVALNTSYQTVVVMLTVGQIEKSPTVRTVVGRLRDAASAGKCSWIRLISPFVPDRVFEGAVYKGGFGFDGVPPGTYLAVVMGKEGLCGISRVNILLGQTDDVVVEPGRDP
jgi:hypothetical protein